MASVAVLNGRHTSGKVILEKSLCGYVRDFVLSAGRYPLINLTRVMIRIGPRS